MNEHPGVQPVVIRPQEPSPKPLRALPRNTADMPVGLSANTVGLDGQTNRLRRIVLIGVSLAMLLVVTLGMRLYVKSLEPLKPKTIVNGVYEYTFLFYKDAEPVNLVAGQGFKYGDKALLIAMPTDEAVATGCEKMNTKKDKWQEVFRVQVGGVDRPVCRLGDSTFAVTFFAGKAEHLLAISYTSPHTINTSDVRKIMESAQVTLQ